MRVLRAGVAFFSPTDVSGSALISVDEQWSSTEIKKGRPDTTGGLFIFIKSRAFHKKQTPHKNFIKNPSRFQENSFSRIDNPPRRVYILIAVKYISYMRSMLSTP
jgi:hypothetical protein